MEGRGIEVTVKTPSRLHFGIIDMCGDIGRIHGSVGVAIEQPSLLLKASPAPEITARGPRGDRIRRYAETILRDAGIEGGADFNLVNDIPEHAGFGSGTQLALAVGAALKEMYGLDLSVEEMASKLGRSRISGVGTYAFKHGGFIVDGGRRVDRPDSVPPLIFRSDVPEGWLFVVGLPEIRSALSGAEEREAFKRIEPPPRELVAEVSRMVLLKMIPAIIEHDIEAFGEAMTAMDFKFGEYWIEVQGGRFSNPLIERGVQFLLRSGAYGVGQSSWGPAFYGLVDGFTQAREVSEGLNEFLNIEGKRGEVSIVKPDNVGAEIKVIPG
ncbi:MAG: beta-ribofuranosylaminobenzene 5'-phosphate synthase family protein [Candidatus Bathyarchaeia archaeon]